MSSPPYSKLLRVLLTSATALAALAPAASASQVWPLGAEQTIADVKLSYDTARSLEAPPCLGSDGCFRLDSSVEVNGDHSGGYLYLTSRALPVPIQADLEDTFTYFPVSWSESHAAQIHLPDSVLDAFDIDITVDVTPTFGIPGYPNIAQSIPYSTTSAVTRAWSSLPTPVNSSGTSWLIEPGLRPDWIDSQITLAITITPDASILDGISQGQSYTYEVPLTLQQNSEPFADISPYFVPTAVIGRPPGDQSWSRLTQTSGQAANMSIYESKSSRQSVDTSWGIGPFYTSSSGVATSRTEGIGTYQELSTSFALSVSTNNPYGPGTGDVMVGMVRPEFRLLEAAADLDFELLGAGSLVGVAMQELLNPATSNSSMISNLTADEVQALIDMNPLLSNPHARLSGPRYVHIVTFSDIVGSGFGGSRGYSTISRANVEDAFSRSASSSDTYSLTLPIGALFGSVGVPLPISLDPNFRSSEEITSSIEYRNTSSLTGSGGTMLNFSISDSDPEARLCAQVFYDTIFRTFVFRDCNTEGLEYAISSLIDTYELANPLPPGLTMVRVEDGDDSDYVLIGSLTEEEQEEGSSVRFIAQSEGAVDFEVALLPNTSNLIAPVVQPGKYTVALNGVEYMAQLFEEGESTLEKIGEADDDCVTTTTSEDGCGVLEITLDECSEPITRMEQYTSTCDDVASYEEYCEYNADSGSCQYQDSETSDEWSW